MNWKIFRYFIYGVITGLSIIVIGVEPKPGPQPQPSPERFGACCRQGPDGKECFTMTHKACDAFNDSFWAGYFVCTPEICR